MVKKRKSKEQDFYKDAFPNLEKKMTEETLQQVKKQQTVAHCEGLIAKKHFIISQNEYYRVIVPGEDVSDVPEMFHANLRTEGVI